MIIRYTRDALPDINNLFAFIAQRHGATYARNVAATIKAAINRLERFPNLGRDGQVTGTRELVVPRTSYIVIYLLREDIVIQRVLHTSQQWPPTEEDLSTP